MYDFYNLKKIQTLKISMNEFCSWIGVTGLTLCFSIKLKGFFVEECNMHIDCTRY